MEKFGIFELLDTLSALVEANPREEQKEAPAEAPREAVSVQPKRDDSAYLPPQYGDAEAAVQTAVGGKDALDAFLERHNAISKKIDGNR